MALTLRIEGFFEDYPALVDPDYHDPQPGRFDRHGTDGRRTGQSR